MEKLDDNDFFPVSGQVTAGSRRGHMTLLSFCQLPLREMNLFIALALNLSQYSNFSQIIKHYANLSSFPRRFLFY